MKKKANEINGYEDVKTVEQFSPKRLRENKLMRLTHIIGGVREGRGHPFTFFTVSTALKSLTFSVTAAFVAVKIVHF